MTIPAVVVKRVAAVARKAKNVSEEIHDVVEANASGYAKHKCLIAVVASC